MRYREYVYDSGGKLKSIQRTRILLPAGRTKSQARIEADRFMAQFSESADPRSIMSFSEFWEHHFVPSVVKNLKPATQQLYSALARAHLLPALGGEMLADISRLDIQRFINSKRSAGYSSQTLAHFRNLLSKIFGSALRWSLTTSNPASEIELPPMVRTRQARVLTPEEISILDRELPEPVSTIFLTGVLLGLRIGELLALKVADIDLLRAQVSIRRDVYRGTIGTPKTSAGVRALPLPEALAGRLASACQAKDPDEWLFPNAAGNPLSDKNLMRREVQPVCDRLKIPRFTWHALRHTFSTYQGNSGTPMPVLQSLLGHRTADMSMRYTHPLEDAQRLAVNVLQQKLWPTVAQNMESGKPEATAIQ